MRNTFFRRSISSFLLVALIVSAIPVISVPAYAATSAEISSQVSKNVPAITYTMPLSGAGRVTAYADASLSQKTTGYFIDTYIDQIVILKISADGRAVYVAYPSSSSSTGYRCRWFAAEDILGVSSVGIRTYTATGKATSYRMEGWNSVKSFGSIAANDSCTVLGQRRIGNQNYEVTIYPISAKTANGVTGVKHKVALIPVAQDTVVSNPAAKSVSSGRTVEDGKYYIVSALDDQKALDIAGGSLFSGGNLQLYKCNNSGAQLFQLTYSNKGYYTIKNVNSGLVLDLAGGGTTPGTNVQQYKKNSSAAQQFYFEGAGNGYYYIRSACGLYLDVSGGNTANGTNIQGWRKNGTNAQKFRLVPYVKYTYKTVSLDCSSISAWTTSLLESQDDLEGLIVAQDILEYKTLQVKTAVGPSTTSCKVNTINLPSKVRYKLHSHTFNRGYGRSWRLADNCILIQNTCNCGYYAEVCAWEIPDLTEMSNTQTSRSVISNMPKINK